MKRVKVIITAMFVCIAVTMPCNAYAADAEDWASLEGWFATCNAKLAYIYADTTDIVTQLQSETISGGANTIRYYIRLSCDRLGDIRSNIVNINSNMSSVVSAVQTNTSKIETMSNNIATQGVSISSISTNLANVKNIVDSHTTLLTTINNNINNVWADVQLIKDTTGYINSAVSTISTNISNLNTNVVTIGETMDNIYTDIHSMSTTLSNLYSILNSVKGSYTYNGSTQSYIKTYPGSGSSISDNQYFSSLTTDVFRIQNDIATIKSTINTISSNITSQTTSLGTKLDTVATNITSQTTALGAKLDTVVSSLATISENIAAINSNLNDVKISYTFPSGTTQYFLRTYPGSGSSLEDNQYFSSLTSDIFRIQNDIATIKSTISTISSNITSQTTSLGTKLDTVATNITSQTTALGGKLDNVVSSLATISENISNIYTLLDRVDGTFQYNGIDISFIRTYPGSGSSMEDNQYFSSLTSDVFRIQNDIESIKASISSIPSNIETQTSSIVAKLETMISSLNSIYSKLNAVIVPFEYPSGGLQYYLKVVPGSGSSVPDNQYFSSYTSRMFQLAENVSSIKGQFNTFEQTLEDLYDVCYAILQKQSIPTDSETIIGDFDTDQLDAEILDLKNVMSQVAPFGAITLVSAEFSILSTVAPVDYPQFVFPFDFGGFDQTLVLDLSWLEQAKDFINFFSMFLLIYCLTIWSIKFIKE